MATGILGYTDPTAAEDRATLASDPSAAAAAIRHGRHLPWVPPAYLNAGGPKAINPHFQRPNAVLGLRPPQLCFPRMNLYFQGCGRRKRQNLVSRPIPPLSFFACILWLLS